MRRSGTLAARGTLVLAVACQTPSSSARETPALPARTEIVSFRTGPRTLGGLLLRPEGPGPFPAILYDHGSAPGRQCDLAFATIAPVFAAQGWVFYMPYRRGQGLSAAAGPYIGDAIEAARRRGGLPAAAAEQLRLLETDHLDDQRAAFGWLRRRPWVDARRIAVAGNSLGGIEAVLGNERGGHCAAVDAAGAAKSWSDSPALRARLLASVRRGAAPLYLFQAENDHDLAPTRELFAAARAAGRPAEMKIYPRYGRTAEDGHSLPYRGVAVWGGDVGRFLSRNCARIDTGRVLSYAPPAR